MSQSEPPELLPSIAQILKRAGAIDRVRDVDIQTVSRLPVFQSRSWKRSIAEFLRWSGSTPDTWGTASVFDLLLCHGPAGARALFEAYRHDRLERAATFAEAESQLEAVRTVVSMAAYWVHKISWDLRDAPRLSAEEFRNRRRSHSPDEGNSARERSSAAREEPRPSNLLERVRGQERDPSRRVSATAGVPVFPVEPAGPSLWKSAPEGPEKPLRLGPLPPRQRPPRQ